MFSRITSYQIKNCYFKEIPHGNTYKTPVFSGFNMMRRVQEVWSP